MERRNGNLESGNKNQNPETGAWNAEIKRKEILQVHKNCFA